MKYLLIITLFITSVVVARETSIKKKRSIELSANHKGFANLSFIYTEKYNRLLFGLETGLGKGFGDVESESEVIDGFREYYNEIDYSKLYLINFIPRISVYLSSDSGEYDLNGFLLVLRSGFQYTINNNDYENGLKPGFISSFGIEYIHNSWSGSLQHEIVFNELFFNNYFRIGVRRLF